MSKRRDADGEAAFEGYYGALYGVRWPALRAALLAPVPHATWSHGLTQPYFLDPGSVMAALALPLPEGGSVLDMCAAPGGKSLIIASRLSADGTLVSNEFSRDRKARLLSVLDGHLSAESRLRVEVTGRDAARWSRYETGAFDAILLDAPCSSERHVLSSPKHLAAWSPSRVKTLALRQWSLLSGAWLVLRAGGYLLYSTCALSREENDGVVDRLLAKYPDVTVCAPVPDVRFEAFSVPAETTAHGRLVLPDSSSGAGPLYFALLKKEF
jgi:16S rRNA C967 or C1407 C5-methylase (RsmB/RsmF family)